MQEHLSCKTMPLGVYALWSCHSGKCWNKDNSLIHYIVPSFKKKEEKKNARWQRYVSCHLGWALESQTLLVFFKFLKLWLIMNKTLFSLFIIKLLFKKKEFTCIHLRNNCLRIEKKKFRFTKHCDDDILALYLVFSFRTSSSTPLYMSLQLIGNYLILKRVK